MRTDGPRLILAAILIAGALLTIACDGGFRPSEEAGKLEKVRSHPADPAEQAAAVETAHRFLAKLDRGAIGDAWSDLARLIQQDSDAEQWRDKAREMRLLTGALVSRGDPEATFTRRLHKAPEGKYFLLDYETAFTDAHVRERVVAFLEAGHWKIAGYNMSHIRPVD